MGKKRGREGGSEIKDKIKASQEKTRNALRASASQAAASVKEDNEEQQPPADPEPRKRRKYANLGGREAPLDEGGDNDAEEKVRRRKCKDCQALFPFSEAEEAFFQEKGWRNPTRCKECRQIKKQKFTNEDGEETKPKKKRSKQKNIRKDNRPDHLKPTYRTPTAPDYQAPKPNPWTKKTAEGNDEAMA